jgi:uncharacterized protein (DUF302 family)
MKMMTLTMLKVSKSQLAFEDTVERVRENAEEVGWNVPKVFDLQSHYKNHGFGDMGQATVVYFCNPRGGYDISRDDEFKPMFVMMPTGVCVYETSTGEVQVARMNLGLMSLMFAGVVKRTLKQGGSNLEKALEGIIAA